MADVVFSVGAEDDTRRALRRIAGGFQRLGRTSARSLSAIGRVGAQSLRAVAKAAAITTAAVTAIGVAAAAGFSRILSGAVESATELERFNRLTGVNIETLQTWRTALVDLDGDLGDVQGAISGMSDFLQEVADGNEEAVRTFSLLGLSFEEVVQASPARQLELISGGLRSIEASGTRASVAHRIMGEDFEKLNTIFSRTDAEMAALVERTNYLSQANLATAAVIRGATSEIGTAFHSLALDVAGSWLAQIQAGEGAVFEIVTRLDNLIAYVQTHFQDIGPLLINPFTIFGETVIAGFRVILAGARTLVANVAEFLNRIPGVNIDTSGLREAAASDLLRVDLADQRVHRQIEEFQEANQRRRDFFAERQANPQAGLIQTTIERAAQQTTTGLVGGSPTTGGGPAFVSTVVPETEADDTSIVEDMQDATRDVDSTRRRRATVLEPVAAGPGTITASSFQFTFNFYGAVYGEGLQDRIIIEIQRALDRGRVQLPA